MPILQIVCSTLPSPHRLDGELFCVLTLLMSLVGSATALAIRLADATHLLSVTPNTAFVSPTHDFPVAITSIGELPTALTEDRRHVDVALDPLSWGKAAVVDEAGGVWLWSEGRETISGRIQRVYKVSVVPRENAARC